MARHQVRPFVLGAGSDKEYENLDLERSKPSNIHHYLVELKLQGYMLNYKSL